VVLFKNTQPFMMYTFMRYLFPFLLGMCLMILFQSLVHAGDINSAPDVDPSIHQPGMKYETPEIKMPEVGKTHKTKKAKAKEAPPPTQRYYPPPQQVGRQQFQVRDMLRFLGDVIYRLTR